MQERPVISKAVFIGILVIFCCVYYHDMLFMLPYGMHTGAQADRLSVAISFFDNGMDFTKPATLSQYSKGGIVGVEFPAQAYLAALLGKVFGRNHISFFFRLEDTLLVCTALYFLFLACYKRTKSFFFSILAPLFVFCSPVFIGYTCNYLPDPAGAALAMISFYYILEFMERPRTSLFLLALGLLTLGSLIKTSIAIYLIGFIGFTCIERVFVRRKEYNGKQTLLFAGVSILSLVILFISYLYIKHLNETYGSWIFLSRASPFRNWDDVKWYFNESFKHLWMNEYLVLPQYLVFAVVVLAGFPFLFKSRLGRQQALLALFYTIGALCMFVLMGVPMMAHDYYFASIFMPLLAYCLIISMIQFGSLPYTIEGRRAINTSLMAATCVMFFFADYYHHQRQREDYPGFSAYYRTYWMGHAKEFLEEMKVPKKEKIAVLNEPEPNLSLVYFDHKGFVIEPGRWGDNMGIVRSVMTENKLRYLVVETKQAEAMIARDSNRFSEYELLASKDQKSLYLFKPNK